MLETILDLKKSGFTNAEIAVRLGIHANTVSHKLRSQSPYTAIAPVLTLDGLTLSMAVCKNEMEFYASQIPRVPSDRCIERVNGRVDTTSDQYVRSKGLHLTSYYTVYGSTVSGVCIAHGCKFKGVRTTDLNRRKTLRPVSPGCKICAKEQLQYARSHRKPDSKTLRFDCLGRFKSDTSWAEKPTHFYFVAIGGRHTKLGIAVDLHKRSQTARYQGRPYGDTLFLSEQLPRAWVWTAEQIILRETAHLTPKRMPTKVKVDVWAGTSELRTSEVQPSWIQQRFAEIISSIKECGSWLSVYQSTLEPGLVRNLSA
jgi:hypothetical protein